MQGIRSGTLLADIGYDAAALLDWLKQREVAAAMSRFEHAASRKDIYRFSQALAEQFITGFACAPRTAAPAICR